jgi:hypothetical protein
MALKDLIPWGRRGRDVEMSRREEDGGKEENSHRGEETRFFRYTTRWIGCSTKPFVALT